MNLPKEAPLLITGTTGMVGSAMARILRTKGFTRLLTPARKELDLLDHAAVDSYFAKHRPQFVFMVAATVGGIAANAADPVGFLSSNLRMQLNLFEACFKYPAQKNL